MGRNKRIKVISPGTVVHCANGTHAKQLIKIAYKLGYKWSHGFENETHYHMYRRDTVYYFDESNGKRTITYGNIANAEYYERKVIEYEDLYEVESNNED